MKDEKDKSIIYIPINYITILLCLFSEAIISGYHASCRGTNKVSDG